MFGLPYRLASLLISWCTWHNKVILIFFLINRVHLDSISLKNDRPLNEARALALHTCADQLKRPSTARNKKLLKVYFRVRMKLLEKKHGTLYGVFINNNIQCKCMLTN